MCFECNGHGHLARDCANRAAKSVLPQARNEQFLPQTLNCAPQTAGWQNQNFGGCYECGECGHIARDCAKRAQRLANQGKGQQGNFGQPEKQNLRNPSTCNNCGIVGYFGRDCPDKNRGNYWTPPRHF